MAIAKHGSRMRVVVARTRHGTCGRCYQPVVAGQAYVNHVGGTNSRPSHLVHYNCYKPTGAPEITDKTLVAKGGHDGKAN